MATRFHGRGRGDRPARDTSDEVALGAGLGESGLGEWWAAIAVLAVAALAVVALSGSAQPEPSPEPRPDPTPDLLAAIEPATTSLSAIEAGLRSLCQAPVLLALELEPDCETGVITISDPLFAGFGSAELSPEGAEDLRAAMRVYLSRLRKLPALWNALEAIEFRGHSDPRAARRPYTTNMYDSQQRPLGVLIFLVGRDGLASKDRSDLERLAIVSGASFSRPPASCPERTRECYPHWRRVEIRPVFSESKRREAWADTLDAVRQATARAASDESG